MTNLYQINLPDFDNSGHKLTMAHRHFKLILVRRAGGYSVTQAEEAWYDETSDITYHETQNEYTVACEPSVWQQIVNDAFKAFDDQIAIFTARIGTATIINRSEYDDTAMYDHGQRVEARAKANTPWDKPATEPDMEAFFI